MNDAVKFVKENEGLDFKGLFLKAVSVETCYGVPDHIVK